MNVFSYANHRHFHDFKGIFSMIEGWTLVFYKKKFKMIKILKNLVRKAKINQFLTENLKI